jgi:hypothetical protein
MSSSSSSSSYSRNNLCLNSAICTLHFETQCAQPLKTVLASKGVRCKTAAVMLPAGIPCQAQAGAQAAGPAARVVTQRSAATRPSAARANATLQFTNGNHFSSQMRTSSLVSSLASSLEPPSPAAGAAEAAVAAASSSGLSKISLICSQEGAGAVRYASGGHNRWM